MKTPIKTMLLCLLCLFILNTACAETIYVKYRATSVDISNGHFVELNLKSSSVVKRIIFDQKNQYLLVKLNNTFYHYCGIAKEKVDAWQNADSLGSFYNENIRGNYDCRIFPVPEY